MAFARGFGALREREFRLLFTGQAVSLLGDGMVPVALAFGVLDVSDSASALGLVFAARTAPLVAFLLVGGVVGDRVSRRALLLGADLVRCASQGTMAALLITGAATIWQLALLAAIGGTATAFFNPASTGLLPMTVSAPRLQQANALRGLAQSTGLVAGPVIAGVLVAAAGAGWALAADAVTFAVSASFLVRLRPAARAVTARGRSFVAELREGWDAFRSRTWVWTIVGSAAVGNMLSASYRVLGPLVAKQSLGGASSWAFITAAVGAGSFAGGVVVLRVHPPRPLVVALLAVGLWPISWLMLAIPAPTGAIAAGGFAGGAGLMVFNALWETALQQHIPSELLSRVSAYDWFGSIAFEPVGMAVVGFVAGAVGVSETLWVAGSVNLILSLAVLAIPSVRRLERVRPLASRPALSTAPSS